MSIALDKLRPGRTIDGSTSQSKASVRTPPSDWNAIQQKLYIARDDAARAKSRLNEIIMHANPHSQDALDAIAGLMHADKGFRRADEAWKHFIKNRLQDDPSWQIPEV